MARSMPWHGQNQDTGSRTGYMSALFRQTGAAPDTTVTMCDAQPRLRVGRRSFQCARLLRLRLN